MAKDPKSTKKMARWHDDFDGYYPPSTPLPAKGGIRAHSRRGAFASNWWGRRWLETLESFQLHSRLARGRSYARRGQVTQLEIAKQKVAAAVQGSRPHPYNVTIQLNPIPTAQWRKVGGVLAENIAIAAKLIAGELPAETERCFLEAGVPLFPARKNDLITACSCPDSSNPCKHIAAVYYLLAEQFDHDPFLLFSLRGMERKDFVEIVGIGSGARAVPDRFKPISDTTETASAMQPLATGHEKFWRGRRLPNMHDGDVTIAGEAAPLARRLGSLPFWRGRTDFLQAIAERSRKAAEHGLTVLLKLPNS
jgi:uncharacterized Zn finger protein